MSPLPAPRGPVSADLLEVLQRPLSDLPPSLPSGMPEPGDDPWTGEDSQLALYLCFELGYRGLDGVDPRWETAPDLVGLRDRLSERLVDAVALTVDASVPTTVAGVVDALARLAVGNGGPSLSRWMGEHGRLDHLREFAVHRSAYQLKEADAHTFAIARLPAGRAKSAYVEIQMDEYGNGVPGGTHQELFAATLEALGLDHRYGAYIDTLPAVTLAAVNLLSAFVSSRRWLGASVGHLALFEMTSVGPMGRYARVVRELSGSEEAAYFYDVHVEADAHHERLAVDHLVTPLLEAEPDLASDVLFGARALAAVESRFTAHLLSAWTRGSSSLRNAMSLRELAGGDTNDLVLDRHGRADVGNVGSGSRPYGCTTAAPVGPSASVGPGE